MLTFDHAVFFLHQKDDFEVEDAPQLLELISNVVVVERFGSEANVVLTDRPKILSAAARLTMLLLEHPEDAVSTADLKKQYEITFAVPVSFAALFGILA